MFDEVKDFGEVKDIDNMPWYDRLGMFLNGGEGKAQADIENHGHTESPWRRFGRNFAGLGDPYEEIKHKDTDEDAGTSYKAGLGMTGSEQMKVHSGGMTAVNSEGKSGSSIGSPIAYEPEPSLQQVNYNENDYSM